jgi:hypothetical protein
MLVWEGIFLEYTKIYNKDSYILNQDDFDKFLQLAIEVNNENEDTEKPVTISINFSNGIKNDKLSIEEATEILSNNMTTPIDSISIERSGYLYDNYLDVTFNRYSINVRLGCVEESKLTFYITKIDNYINNIKSSLLYRFLAEDRPFLYTLILFSVTYLSYFLLTFFIFTDSPSKTIATIIYIILNFGLVLKSRLFPKSRLMFGQNIKKEKKLALTRNILWTYILLPTVSLLRDYIFK